MSPLSSAGHVHLSVTGTRCKTWLTVSGLVHENRDRPQPPQGTRAEQ
ncbi:hypothetical protein AB28_5574 [Raoultella ornithinolytica 2-156-04_S1_C2]|nr:hypothetical protein AB00_5669 [Raoultella ornithinolytica 2-156-04_S1_C1]KDX07868.1 hypothetical protein AB28_5574 [Raoultella ornithinolytica 2-156-04_S1_C2]